MLHDEAMVVGGWHNNGPQDLVTVSLCIQNAINKMHLCSLSIIHACPHHNPTMGHSIHNADITKSLTHIMPHTLSAICPEQWKPGFIRDCSQVKTRMRTTSVQRSFPEMVSDSLCRNSLVMQTDCCSSCSGGWPQTILAVDMPDVEVFGWCGYTWSAVAWTFLQSACQLHAPSKPVTSVALCFVIKLNISEWPFIVAGLRHTCAIIMPSNQHLDMPHLWGGMDYLGKGEVLTNPDLERFVNNIWEKWFFCVYRKCFRSLSSAHEKWEKKQKSCIYIFVQCIFLIIGAGIFAVDCSHLERNSTINVRLKR